MKKIIYILIAFLVTSCIQEDLSNRGEVHERQHSLIAPKQSKETLYREQSDHYNILFSFVCLDEQNGQYSISLTSQEASDLGISQEEYQEVLEIVSRINQHSNNLK